MDNEGNDDEDSDYDDEEINEEEYDELVTSPLSVVNYQISPSSALFLILQVDRKIYKT